MMLLPGICCKFNRYQLRVAGRSIPSAWLITAPPYVQCGGQSEGTDGCRDAEADAGGSWRLEPTYG